MVNFDVSHQLISELLLCLLSDLDLKTHARGSVNIAIIFIEKLCSMQDNNMILSFMVQTNHAPTNINQSNFLKLLS